MRTSFFDARLGLKLVVADSAPLPSRSEEGKIVHAHRRKILQVSDKYRCAIAGAISIVKQRIRRSVKLSDDGQCPVLGFSR